MADTQEGVKITYRTKESLVAWVSPYFDASIENILEGFYGLCVAHGWQPSTVIAAMRDFAHDHDFELKDEKEN